MSLRLTEQPSLYDHLEKKSVAELLRDINAEDKKVPLAIEAVLPQIEELVNAIEARIKAGGRFFWLGAGTGGKLGVLDVLEVPNTYGVDPEIWQAVLAGGVENLVLDLEEAEDDVEEGWRTLSEKHHITPNDIVVGISASGCTPYVMAISAYVDYPIEIITGPEFITGSTRMKSGTSQKLLCDMISTTLMVRLGRVEGNRMVCANLINNKVIDRLTRTMVERNPQLSYEYCEEVIKKTGGLKKAEEYLKEQGILK